VTWILQETIDRCQEETAAVSVARAMVGRERRGHHRSDRDTAGHNPWAILDAPESNECNLRRVDDAERGIHSLLAWFVTVIVASLSSELLSVPARARATRSPTSRMSVMTSFRSAS
jgi:hypothetical protein